MRLQGKTALITGASRNIGRATALAFAREGADLILNTRTNQGELDAVAARGQGAFAAVLADDRDADRCSPWWTRGSTPSAKSTSW